MSSNIENKTTDTTNVIEEDVQFEQSEQSDQYNISNLSDEELMEETARRFNKLTDEVKSYGAIIVPNDKNVTLEEYVKSKMKKYSDHYIVNPYVVAELNDVLDEYDEDKDLYDCIEEYCIKMYGGYISDEKVMSIANEDSFWSHYEIKRKIEESEVIDNKYKILNISVFLDADSLEDKNMYDSNDKWNEILSNKIKSIDDTKYDLYYLEYI
jgi:hypothetical protein